MSKGLEALKRIKSHYNDRVCIDILEDFDTIEKELKALDIIKEKRVDVAIFFENNNSSRHRKTLTKEECDLLKEVLL